MKTFTRRSNQRVDFDPLKSRSNSTASDIQQSNDNSDPYAFTDAAPGSIKVATEDISQQQVSAAACFKLPN